MSDRLSEGLQLLDTIEQFDDSYTPRVRSVHRHCAPKFDREQKHPLAKVVDARLRQHNWDRNPFYVHARKHGGVVRARKDTKTNKGVRFVKPRMRKTRKERSETLTCVLRAALYHLEVSGAGEYLFEVTCSIEKLAAMIGQVHTYPARQDENGQWVHERKLYDCVLNALKDLELANLIVLAGEFDHEVKRYKAMRIFLRPEFFQSMNLSRQEVTRFIKQHDGFLKHRRKYKEKAAELKKRQLNQELQADFAKISNHGLKTLLKRFKRYYLELNDDKKAQSDIRKAAEKSKQQLKKRRSDFEQHEEATPKQTPPGVTTFNNYRKQYGILLANKALSAVKSELSKTYGNSVDDNAVFERFHELYGAPT
ncbi:hypothetical protein [Idiomarina sp. UBA1919]|uniref:hypothetical protein n=1 Tax=Idiomarina sp. UBA1919 TaxID=1946640 RepID=UPI00257C4E34|nr:hypothetical protein [Idiomarina sp. UBA1919]